MGLPPTMEPPDLTTLKSLLHVSRTIALILFILGVVWVGLTAAADAAAAFGGVIWAGNITYPVIFTLFQLLTWVLLKGPIDQVNHGQYAAAREQTIFPMILGFIALLIVGILLLVAYTKFEPVIAWQRGYPTASPPMWAAPVGAPPAYAQAPPPTAPPASAPAPIPPPMPVPPPAAVAATATCPRCGRPATWIAQYSRWYCYTDQQYL